MRALVVAAALAVVPLAAVAATPAPHAASSQNNPASAKTGPTASSKVSVTMPGELSFAFKPGPGVQTATTYCLTCHSSAYVSTQPVFDRAHWAAEVAKMRKAYGASIPDKDAETIVDYLTAAYGKS